MKKLWIFLVAILCLVGCGNKEEKETKINEMANTIWIASDGSEMVFEEKDFNWYKDEGIHDDNYYTGTYEYYRGKEAVEFITTELADYGVTEAELNRMFSSEDEEEIEENFIVFNMNYTSITIDGETSIPPTSLVPLFGFIVEDDTYLDVVNMNTASYYGFTKK